MNAADILKEWERVSPAFNGKASAWIKMLRLANAGQDGLTIAALTKKKPNGHWAWIQAGVKNKLLTIDKGPPLGRRSRRSLGKVRITSRGLKTLGFESEPSLAVGSSAVVQPWWVKVPWQNYDEMGECPQCIRCGVSMKLNLPDCEWGEAEGAIFNVCNSCAASLLPEMWQRLNDQSLATAGAGLPKP